MPFLRSNQTPSGAEFTWFQQTPSEYLSERTSVTVFSIIVEKMHRQAMLITYLSSVYEFPFRTWEIMSKFSQDLLESMSAQYYFLGHQEALTSSIEGLQDLSQRRLIETSTSTTLLLEGQIQWLENYYVFRNDAEVRDFLREHPFMAQLLADIHNTIKLHFPDSQAFLDVAVDFEAIENHPSSMNINKEIVVSICTSLSPKEAIEALNEFYNKWWLRVSTGARRKISIGLEFV
jgi:hypothetical protein